MTDDAAPARLLHERASGPARRMESLLAHLARKERDRLRMTRVDVDAQAELAAQFRGRGWCRRSCSSRTSARSAGSRASQRPQDRGDARRASPRGARRSHPLPPPPKSDFPSARAGPLLTTGSYPGEEGVTHEEVPVRPARAALRRGHAARGCVRGRGERPDRCSAKRRLIGLSKRFRRSRPTGNGDVRGEGHRRWIELRLALSYSGLEGNVTLSHIHFGQRSRERRHLDLPVRPSATGRLRHATSSTVAGDDQRHG